ncbi:alpha/beta hydrolase [Pelagibacterium sp. H642]|uniref:alpha/beta fold hydrolase n=1 Tax=Pelagibacterium sp. H642 TaxID=1881069 RepID=UPI0028153FDA|nr:alpha/beta hydrolase [Pelagibacterium sp. H642]WMT89112.1 alpha/beta hydrolase [Pelagibacterium sp. H642]
MVYGEVECSQARIALSDTQGNGFPVLLLHGNSNARNVFFRQFQSPLAQRYRLIAIDLPGHGQSGNARDPQAGYTMPGLADTVAEVLDALAIEHLAVVGWSLGGHIGIELIERDPRIAGLMIVGTPPISRGILGVLRGFQPNTDLALTTRGRLRPRDVDRFFRMCFGARGPQDFRALIERTDWRMRRIMGRGIMAGLGVDQKYVVEHNRAPLAVVNGQNEPFARLEYLAGLNYANLWDGRCHVIEKAVHAPFLEAPREFNALLGRFLDDVAAWAAAGAAGGLRRHA